jgi:hypothetical protein
MAELNKITSFVTEPVVYFRCDPPISDFTKKYDGSYIISSTTQAVTIKASEVGRFGSFYHALRRSIFAEGHTVLTWDIKKFNSYLRHNLKTTIEPPGAKVIDLKYGLAYLGQRTDEAPKTTVQSLEVAKLLISDDGWQKAHRHLHRPLAWSVLPELENRTVVDEQKLGWLYSCYEIEGQTNGRLLCHKASNRYLTVHSLAPAQKAVLLPKDYLSDDWYFLLLDYQHMEVSVLAWLAQDEALTAALADPAEFYASLVTFECDPAERRNIGKLIFLPTIYGQQSKNLAERLKLEQTVADGLLDGLKSRFSKSFQWVESKQAALATNPIASDYFGRKRNFADEPAYKRRNFEVQSPASFICLERLCALHQALPSHVQFSVHDGYILVARKKECAEIIRTAKKILESESPIFPALKLKVSCQYGKRLDQMKKLDV